MRSHRLNDLFLGDLLNASLDAALDGETFIGPEVIAEWGNTLASTMRGMYPNQVKSMRPSGALHVRCWENSPFITIVVSCCGISCFDPMRFSGQ